MSVLLRASELEGRPIVLLGVGSHAVVVREAPPAEAAPGRS